MVLGAHAVLCMTEPDFFKIMFCSQNGENRPSLGFFECIGEFVFFFSILQFFLNLDYNESLYYCNCCMFEENFIFAKILVPEISPKMLLANQIARFLNQSQDSKIGCISQRKIFLIFGTMVNNSNIEKPTEPFFQENSFLPKFGQKGPRMAPK